MDGNIVVEAHSSVEIHVFDMQGRAVGSWHGCGSLALEPGVYIVSAGAAQPRKVRIN